MANSKFVLIENSQNLAFFHSNAARFLFIHAGDENKTNYVFRESLLRIFWTAYEYIKSKDKQTEHMFELFIIKPNWAREREREK